MSIKESYAHGTPNWMDLNTSDLAKAKAYYTALLGWEYDDRPIPGGGIYSMAMKNGKSVVGLAQASEDSGIMADIWSMYIAVDDADAAVKSAAEAGATVVMPPMDVMDQGRMAILQDTVGAYVGLWQAGAHKGAEVVNEHGCFCWSEIVTADIPKALEFYKSLGLGNTEAPMGDDMPPYVGFTVGEDMVCGTMLPPSDDVPPHWHCYFAVDNCDAAVETSKAEGGMVINGPFPTPMGPMAVLADPCGTVFSVMQFAEQG